MYKNYILESVRLETSNYSDNKVINDMFTEFKN